MGRTAEAIEPRREVLTRDPEYAHGHFNLGVLLFKLDGFEQSPASFGRAIALDEADADCQVRRGMALEALDRKREALAAFTRASALDDTKGIVYFMRANMQFDLGRLRIALADYTPAETVS